MNENWNKDLSQKIGEHSGHIAALQAGQAESLKDRKEIYGLIREIHSDVQEMKNRPVCSNPNACVELSKKVETHDSLITDLRMFGKLIVGGSVVAWVVFAACCYAAWDYAKEHFIIHLK